MSGTEAAPTARRKKMRAETPKDDLNMRAETPATTERMKITSIFIAILIMATAAQAYTGRKATLYTEACVMLTVNEPYRWGSTDCSGMMWRLLKKTFPELGLRKWFKRTTADAMAGWPWKPVMKLDDAAFGDLYFCGHPRIDHVMMAWDRAWDDAIHAAKSKGFSRTKVEPYWTKKISVIVRPPY